MIDKVLAVIVAILAVLTIVNLILILVLNSKLSLIRRKQIVLEKRFKGETIEELLFKVFNSQEDIKKDLSMCKEVVEELKEKQKDNFDMAKIVRYNASRDAGAKLSYSVGFSNEAGDGIIITGLHYNDGVNVYVKKFSDGSSDIPLSKEEEAALDRSKLFKNN